MLHHSGPYPGVILSNVSSLSLSTNNIKFSADIGDSYNFSSITFLSVQFENAVETWTNACKYKTPS